MKYPPYPAYKPSGVQWIGDVPEHWDVKKLKYAASINDEALSETTEPEYEFNYVDIGSVSFTEGITKHETMEFENAPSRARRIVKKGDTIVSTVRTYLRAIASIGTFDDPLIVSTGFAVVRPQTCEAGYLSYALRERSFVESVVARSTGVSYPAINASEIVDISILLPSPNEQKSIAAFLGRETGRIDSLVAKKKQLIERLKEKRSALISRTVTRCLPPDAAQEFGLQPHAQFKPSGIDWLGDIPEGWEVKKFSHEVSIVNGQVNPLNEPYATMLLIGPEHVESKTGKLLRTETAIDQAAESGKYLCPEGSIIYSKIRPALQKLVIAPKKCLCSADMYPLNGSDLVDNSYLYWLLLSDRFLAWSVLESDRVAMPKINRDTFSKLRIPIPSLAEQTEIASYLDRETAKLDQLTAKVSEAIERLQEYRTALITAAVTGKINVDSASSRIAHEKSAV
ncbi:MAG: restriction endonuclease subunit S [Pontiella sp.]